MSSIDPAVQAVLSSRESALSSQIQYSLLGKQLEANKQAGQAIVDLLEGAAQLSRSNNSGGAFDATA